MFKANYISLFFRLERPESEEVIISSWLPTIAVFLTWRRSRSILGSVDCNWVSGETAKPMKKPISAQQHRLLFPFRLLLWKSIPINRVRNSSSWSKWIQKFANLWNELRKASFFLPASTPLVTTIKWFHPFPMMTNSSSTPSRYHPSSMRIKNELTRQKCHLSWQKWNYPRSVFARTRKKWPTAYSLTWISYSCCMMELFALGISWLQ